MSKTAKIVLWVVVLIIVIVVIAWFVISQGTSAPTAPTAQNAPATNGAPSASGSLSTSPADTSNAALNQDLTSINSELNGLASDSANVNQGLNDQPVTQGQ